MAVLIVLETIVVGLLAVLVAGLLRSHAQILAELAALRSTTTSTSGAASGAAPTPVDAPRRVPGARATDVIGTTPAGDQVSVAVAGTRVTTLLAFLSSGCSSCVSLWQALGEGEGPALADRTRLVVVTLGAGEESPARVRRLAPPGVLVVMSSDAWQDYGVPGAPYFVQVAGDGRVVGEGSARTWTEVLSLAGDALADGAGCGGHRAREQRVDDELAAAGIQPGDPRLHHPPAGGAA